MPSEKCLSFSWEFFSLIPHSFDRFECSFFSAHAAHVFQQQQTLPLFSKFIMRTFKFQGTLIVKKRESKNKEGADRQIFLKTPRNEFIFRL